MLGNAVSTRTGARRIGYRGRLSDSGLWSVSEGESERECDECPVGCSTHHPDPSRRTVVPRRGARATNSHSVAWISCQRVRQSRFFANYYTVWHSSGLPCPCTCTCGLAAHTSQPGQPGQPSRRWCVPCIRSTWAWNCLDSASKIPRNDQASCDGLHSHTVCGTSVERLVSRRGQPRDCGNEGDQQPKAG